MMPDREGSLNDNELLVAGEVWRVSPSLAEPAFACDRDGCPSPAVIEACCIRSDPDGWGWNCFCEKHERGMEGHAMTASRRLRRLAVLPRDAEALFSLNPNEWARRTWNKQVGRALGRLGARLYARRRR